MQIKQPASVLWLVHSLEVLVTGAVFTLVITVYQAFQSGNFDLGKVGVTAVSLLVAFLGNGMKGIINNANFAQALQDLYNEIFRQGQQSQAQPPVVVNVQHPAQVQAPVVSQPVPPMPMKVTPQQVESPFLGNAQQFRTPAPDPQFSAPLQAMPRQ